jgi:hypothetical protein
MPVNGGSRTYRSAVIPSMIGSVVARAQPVRDAVLPSLTRTASCTARPCSRPRYVSTGPSRQSRRHCERAPSGRPQERGHRPPPIHRRSPGDRRAQYRSLQPACMVIHRLLSGAQPASTNGSSVSITEYLTKKHERPHLTFSVRESLGSGASRVAGRSSGWRRMTHRLSVDQSV